MTIRSLALGPGVRLFFDGDLVEVVELQGVAVVIRNERTPVDGARGTLGPLGYRNGH